VPPGPRGGTSFILHRAGLASHRRLPLSSNVRPQNQMPQLTLIGDSIFDNAPYTEGGPAVINHLRDALPSGWSCDLKAVDGATTKNVEAQLNKLRPDTTHICLSVGGNDLIERFDLLDMPVQSSAEALLLLSDACLEFRKNYRTILKLCLRTNLPVVVCTIYNCCFPTPQQQQTVEVALAIFNNEIISAALDNRLNIIELRRVCTESEDYANPIEPSVVGGKKIAQAIVRSFTQPNSLVSTSIAA